MSYGLRSKFDINKHKEKYINYLKVVIDSDGVVHYATPTYPHYLLRMICRTKHVDIPEILDNLPDAANIDWLGWLCQQTGCVCVFHDWVKGYGTPIMYSDHIDELNATEAQKKTLRELIDNGLLKLEN